MDPNRADLRAEPRNTRDLAIAASNAWIMGFDNLSSIEPWLSDALCRLSTGGGFATRQLYTDREEAIFDSKRPVVLTGIEEIATRGDLIDRCISIELQPIREAGRKTESEIWAALNASAGWIFGALLDAVAHALRAHRDLRLPALPRMADFATWATAAEAGLGLPAGAVMAAYQRNRADANETALASAPTAALVIALVREQGVWSGTATELLRVMEGRADDWARRGKGWPRTARAMAGALRRVAPNMRKAGIRIEFSRAAGHDRQRVITMSMAPPPALEISAEPPKPVGECPQAASDDGRASTGHGPTGLSDNRTKEGEASDDPDGSDDVAGAFLRGCGDMRRPWLRDWSCGATRQLCKMAGPKNIEESAGTTVRIVRTVRRVHIPRGFAGVRHKYSVRTWKLRGGCLCSCRKGPGREQTAGYSLTISPTSRATAHRCGHPSPHPPHVDREPDLG